MSINLVTYANQTVTPTNDAIIYERAIDQNGIFYGCNVTVTSNNVNITGGYGIVCGREFVINSDSLTVTLAPSGTLEGRLYVRLDLADADAPIQLLTVTGNTLPALVQDDDVNYTNGVYEMELATFTVGVSSLSDVVETFENIIGTKPYADYIVEQGTEGIWTYRKWNSGTAECWGIYGFASASFSASGQVYYRTIGSISFPSELLVTVPHVECSVQMGNPGGCSISNISTSSVSIGVLSSVSAARSGNIFIRAIGTWK